MDKESGKIFRIGYIVVVVLLILILRLWQLQILQGNQYRELSESNRLRVISIPAPRGILFDRNGIPLVRNFSYFFASVTCGEFDRSKIHLLSNVLNMPAQEILFKINQERLGAFNPINPVRLKEGLSFEEVAYIEARKSDLPGLNIETEASREYIYGQYRVTPHRVSGKIKPFTIQPSPLYRTRKAPATS